jgi:hypothetical protein
MYSCYCIHGNGGLLMERELEEKYGKNDLDMLIICPRCADAV